MPPIPARFTPANPFLLGAGVAMKNYFTATIVFIYKGCFLNNSRKTFVYPDIPDAVTSPYTEEGFTIIPTNGLSAVFDSAAVETMIGNNMDWFGFEETNTPSLTLTATTGPFDLNSLVLGPSTIASSSVINMTITGNLFGGGTVSSTFNGLSTATTGILNWTNLTSVDFMASDDAGLDDINVTPVPEPASFALAALGLLGIGFLRRKWR